MVRKLQLKISLLFSILTSIIFIGMSVFTWNLSCEQYRSNAISNFSSHVSSVIKHLNSTQILRDSWLSEQESIGSCIIYIEDSGKPLHFESMSANLELREELISLAKNSMPADITNSSNPVYSFEDSNQTLYLCSYSKILLQGQSTASLWMIKDNSSMQSHIQNITFIYILIDIVACLLLTVVCIFMSILSTAPVKDSLRRQNEFIAAASHELRSPLTVIKANLDAAETSTDTSQQHMLLQSVRKETDRLKRLSDDLLLLTGSDAEIMHMSLKPVALDTFLIQLFETFHSVCLQRNHELILTLPDSELPCVSLDQERLQQLFGILILNALDYTDEGTSIDLGIHISHGNAILQVIDHGPGIPDNEKKRVFQRFYRSDQSRTNKNHYGLGLAVAAEIIREHKAGIEIADTPGGGATFLITLKL